MKIVTVHRFHPMIIFKGGGYPIKSVEITAWDKDINKAIKAFEAFNIRSVGKSELSEMEDGNLNDALINCAWIYASIESATIPMTEYKKLAKSGYDDTETVGNACEWDFKTTQEVSFMPDGKKVPKKLYKSMYGE